HCGRAAAASVSGQHLAALDRCNRSETQGSVIRRTVFDPGPARIRSWKVPRLPAVPQPHTMPARFSLFVPALIGALGVSAMATAQAPPPPPTSVTTTPPPRTPGLSPELAEASQKIREGEYVTALAKIDAVLATDAKNVQARFLKGVVQT